MKVGTQTLFTIGSGKQKNNPMQYIKTTTKQEAVEADSPEEALKAEGKTIDITMRASPRPTPPAALQPRTISPALGKL